MTSIPVEDPTHDAIENASASTLRAVLKHLIGEVQEPRIIKLIDRYIARSAPTGPTNKRKRAQTCKGCKKAYFEEENTSGVCSYYRIHTGPCLPVL